MPLFDPYWTQALRGLLPRAAPFFTVVTALGTVYTYIILIATGYWTWDKRQSMKVAFLLLASSATNYWLKATRYAITAIVALFVWPMIFTKLDV